jgi:photosynthetic reaction center cytochrome c subunit
MTIISRRTILGATAAMVVWLAGAVWAGGQAPAPAPGTAQRPPMSEEVFKNVRVLRGIPVDEFMGTMGIFSAALGMSCEDCHSSSDTTWENYALDTSPRKATARRMVQMMNSINQASFGGRQVVTCYTCHHGTSKPRVTPSLAALYGSFPIDDPDEVVPAPGAPPAAQILDKYIQALGGQQRLAAITSFIAKGIAVGYGPEGTDRPIEIYAKAPNQRTTIIHTLSGDSTSVYDGRLGWHAAPHKPVAVLPLSGGELDNVKLDAELSFPGRIKETLRDWRVGLPTEIDEKPVQVVQGTAGGALATFYFDSDSGLLVRMVRYANSKVGRLPTQIDYSDYRDVSGVKMPFKFKVTWLDGLENVTLNDIQVNVPIDPARFGKPAAPPQ